MSLRSAYSTIFQPVLQDGTPFQGQINAAIPGNVAIGDSNTAYTLSINNQTITSTSGNLNISGNIVATGSLTVSAATVSNALNVSGITTVSALNVQNYLNVSGLSSLSNVNICGAVNITGNTFLNNNLEVKRSLSAESVYSTTLSGVVNINGAPYVAGGNPFNWSTLPAISDVNMSGYSINNVNNLTVFNNVSISGSASINSGLSAESVYATTLSGVTLINGAPYIPGVNPANWATFPAVANLSMGGFNIGNTNAVSISGRLVVDGSATINGLVRLSNANVSGLFNVSGGNVQNKWNVSGQLNAENASIVANLGVSGDTVLSNAYITALYGGATTLSSLAVQSNVSVSGETLLVGKVTVSDILNVSGLTTMSELTVQNNLSVGGIVYATNLSAVSFINGISFNAAGIPSNWASYGAVGDVDLSGNDIYNVDNLNVSGLSVFAGGISIPAIATISHANVIGTVSASNVYVSNVLNVSGLASLSGAVIQNNFNVCGLSIVKDLTIANTSGLIVISNTTCNTSGNIQYLGTPYVPAYSVGERWNLTSTSTSINGFVSSDDGLKLVGFSLASARIFTSSNGGVTWTNANDSPVTGWRVLASSADGSRLAITRVGLNIYTSSNSGLNWTNANNSPYLSWRGIASSANGSILVAVGQTGSPSSNVVYRSTDFGTNWTLINNSVPAFLGVIRSSTDGSKLVSIDNFNPSKIYTSTDGGVNWTNANDTPSIQWRDIASSSDGVRLVALGDNGKIYTSSNSGLNWTNANDSPSLIWLRVSSSANGQNLAAIALDNKIYTSSNYGLIWTNNNDSLSSGWSGIATTSDGSKLIANTNTGDFYTSIASAEIETTGTLLINPINAVTVNGDLNVSGGRMGIGTTDPSALMHVYSNGTTTAGAATLFVTNNYNGLNSTGSDSTEAIVAIGSMYGGIPYYTSLQAKVNPSAYGDQVRLDICTPLTANNNTQQPRMTVLANSGNVGIGTTNPEDLLHVKGAAYPGILITDTINTADGFSMLRDHLSNKTILRGSGRIDIETPANFPRMTFLANGNAGIGTTAPNSKLHVVYSGITENQKVVSIRTADTGTQNYNLIEAGHGGSAIAFVVKGTGSVGINCNAPAYTLDVNGTANIGGSTRLNGSVLIDGGSAGRSVTNAIYTGGHASPAAQRVYFGDGSGWRYIWARSSDSTDLMTLQDNGNLGVIGTINCTSLVTTNPPSGPAFTNIVASGTLKVAGGSVTYGISSAVYNGNGAFNLTFSNTQVDTNYIVIATVIDTDSIVCTALSKTTTTFSIRSYISDNKQFIGRDISFVVYR
jgi:hypothetical protein